MTIKAINDLSRHLEPLHDELAGVIDKVVRGGWFVLGENVRAFEASFARWASATAIGSPPSPT